MPNDIAKPEKESVRNTAIQAGRDFAYHYKTILTPGDRGVLRQADIIATNEAFWACLRQAEKKWPAIASPARIRIFQLLISSGILAKCIQSNGIESDKLESVGVFMRKNKEKIKGRRVESMFSATTAETAIDELSRLVSIIEKPKIDMGLLFNDLTFFGDKVRRQWAVDCFRLI